MDSLPDKLLRFWRTQKAIGFVNKGAIVCDIGCGLDFYLLKKIRGSISKGVGLDQDLKSYSEGNIELKNIIINSKLPLGDNYFDVVIMVAFLEHLNKPNDILTEVFRILKTDGKLVITTPSPIAKPILNLLAFLNFIDRREISDHKNYFWPTNIKKMLIHSGFSRENIKINFFEFFTNTLIVVKK